MEIISLLNICYLFQGIYSVISITVGKISRDQVENFKLIFVIWAIYGKISVKAKYVYLHFLSLLAKLKI